MGNEFTKNVIIQRKQDGLLAIIIKTTARMITVIFETSRRWKVKEWSRNYIENFFNVIGKTEAIDLQKASEDMKKFLEKSLNH